MTHRFLLMVLATLCLTVRGTALAADDLADWQAWRAEFEAGYAKARFGVLKVNDAVFLKPGQAAYLEGVPDDPSSYRWSLDASPGAILSVAFSAGDAGRFKARLKRGREELDALALFGRLESYPVNDTVDLTGRVTGEGAGDPRLQLKIFNQDHPAARAFKGLEFFDFSKRFRIEAEYRALSRPRAVILDTERGLRKRFYRHGTAMFELNNLQVVLPLYAPVPDAGGVQEFFTLFTDHTTGRETYGVGRYMDVPVPRKSTPGQVLIDFNRAYNPLCARSAHYNCPLVEFQIPADIRAGEKNPGKRPPRP